MTNINNLSAVLLKHKIFPLSNKELSILESIASYSKSQRSNKACDDACFRHESEMESTYTKCLLWSVSVCAKNKSINLHDVDNTFFNLGLDNLSKEYRTILAFHMQEFILDLINILDAGYVGFYPKVNNET